MNNNNINTNYIEKTDENDYPEEGVIPFTNENEDIESIDDIRNPSDTVEIDGTNTNTETKVAEKVKVFTLSQTPIITNYNNNNKYDNHNCTSNRISINNNYDNIKLNTYFQNPEDIVRQWKANNKETKLTPNFRKIACQPSIIQLSEERVITVSNLVGGRFNIYNTQKLISQAPPSKDKTDIEGKST